MITKRVDGTELTDHPSLVKNQVGTIRDNLSINSLEFFPLDSDYLRFRVYSTVLYTDTQFWIPWMLLLADWDIDQTY